MCITAMVKRNFPDVTILFNLSYKRCLKGILRRANAFGCSYYFLTEPGVGMYLPALSPLGLNNSYLKVILSVNIPFILTLSTTQ